MNFSLPALTTSRARMRRIEMENSPKKLPANVVAASVATSQDFETKLTMTTATTVATTAEINSAIINDGNSSLPAVRGQLSSTGSRPASGSQQLQQPNSQVLEPLPAIHSKGGQRIGGDGDHHHRPTPPPTPPPQPQSTAVDQQQEQQSGIVSPSVLTNDEIELHHEASSPSPAVHLDQVELDTTTPRQNQASVAKTVRRHSLDFRPEPGRPGKLSATSKGTLQFSPTPPSVLRKQELSSKFTRLDFLVDEDTRLSLLEALTRTERLQDSARQLIMAEEEEVYVDTVSGPARRQHYLRFTVPDECRRVRREEEDLSKAIRQEESLEWLRLNKHHHQELMIFYERYSSPHRGHGGSSSSGQGGFLHLDTPFCECQDLSQEQLEVQSGLVTRLGDAKKWVVGVRKLQAVGRRYLSFMRKSLKDVFLPQDTRRREIANFEEDRVREIFLHYPFQMGLVEFNDEVKAREFFVRKVEPRARLIHVAVPFKLGQIEFHTEAIHRRGVALEEERFRFQLSAAEQISLRVIVPELMIRLRTIEGLTLWVDESRLMKVKGAQAIWRGILAGDLGKKSSLKSISKFAVEHRKQKRLNPEHLSTTQLANQLSAVESAIHRDKSQEALLDHRKRCIEIAEGMGRSVHEQREDDYRYMFEQEFVWQADRLLYRLKKECVAAEEWARPNIELERGFELDLLHVEVKESLIRDRLDFYEAVKWRDILSLSTGQPEFVRLVMWVQRKWRYLHAKKLEDEETIRRLKVRIRSDLKANGPVRGSHDGRKKSVVSDASSSDEAKNQDTTTAETAREDDAPVLLLGDEGLEMDLSASGRQNHNNHNKNAKGNTPGRTRFAVSPQSTAMLMMVTPSHPYDPLLPALSSPSSSPQADASLSPSLEKALQPGEVEDDDVNASSKKSNKTEEEGEAISEEDKERLATTIDLDAQGRPILTKWNQEEFMKRYGEELFNELFEQLLEAEIEARCKLLDERNLMMRYCLIFREVEFFVPVENDAELYIEELTGELPLVDDATVAAAAAANSSSASTTPLPSSSAAAASPSSESAGEEGDATTTTSRRNTRLSRVTSSVAIQYKRPSRGLFGAGSRALSRESNESIEGSTIETSVHNMALLQPPSSVTSPAVPPHPIVPTLQRKSTTGSTFKLQLEKRRRFRGLVMTIEKTEVMYRREIVFDEDQEFSRVSAEILADPTFAWLSLMGSTFSLNRDEDSERKHIEEEQEKIVTDLNEQRVEEFDFFSGAEERRKAIASEKFDYGEGTVGGLLKGKSVFERKQSNFSSIGQIARVMQKFWRSRGKKTFSDAAIMIARKKIARKNVTDIAETHIAMLHEVAIEVLNVHQQRDIEVEAATRDRFNEALVRYRLENADLLEGVTEHNQTEYFLDHALEQVEDAEEAKRSVHVFQEEEQFTIIVEVFLRQPIITPLIYKKLAMINRLEEKERLENIRLVEARERAIMEANRIIDLRRLFPSTYDHEEEDEDDESSSGVKTLELKSEGRYLFIQSCLLMDSHFVGFLEEIAPMEVASFEQIRSLESCSREHLTRQVLPWLQSITETSEIIPRIGLPASRRPGPSAWALASRKKLKRQGSATLGGGIATEPRRSTTTQLCFREEASRHQIEMSRFTQLLVLVNEAEQSLRQLVETEYEAEQLSKLQENFIAMNSKNTTSPEKSGSDQEEEDQHLLVSSTAASSGSGLNEEHQLLLLEFERVTECAQEELSRYNIEHVDRPTHFAEATVDSILSHFSDVYAQQYLNEIETTVDATQWIYHSTEIMVQGLTKVGMRLRWMEQQEGRHRCWIEEAKEAQQREKMEYEFRETLYRLLGSEEENEERWR